MFLKCGQTSKLFYVGIAPAVDALFAVTHYQIKPAVRQRVIYERQNVVPLQGAGILKLVEQQMAGAVWSHGRVASNRAWLSRTADALSRRSP